MKISHHISSLKRRNQIDRGVDQINDEDFVNINHFIETTSSSGNGLPHSNNYQDLNNYQAFGSDDDINNHPLETNSAWRILAILGLVWTIVILLVVFIFIIKKTVLSPPDADQLPETNPENEWMIASFENSDNENIEVPLSTNVSRETIDN
ncbi:hypothetical protein RhiirA1_421323 [Rhizophagus irregularis]|uniref:Uncharacterized protein n=2 Tax=Rhizophagus irregularis TaxID=588596 RepID=A0A2I1DR10_9GLOM|nr:hypothetical protein RhiirA1_421323 [Rhizophagus irregularis]PKY12316.1 hypothetical protein RhiirB3_397247 [Rhizophagus irregularis]CAB4491438.1 unnamed protein product [Rhizophagus irregularis]CAB5216374.1 unnamed protein product [Rhizophagus irregularis]CAB5374412.1 unnamed protein product [Rhizophagus irregularis]